MKYEVPEINISKFSIENIVTASAMTAAEAALTSQEAFANATNKAVVKTTMDGWVSAN